MREQRYIPISANGILFPSNTTPFWLDQALINVQSDFEYREGLVRFEKKIEIQVIFHLAADQIQCTVGRKTVINGGKQAAT